MPSVGRCIANSCGNACKTLGKEGSQINYTVGLDLSAINNLYYDNKYVMQPNEKRALYLDDKAAQAACLQDCKIQHNSAMLPDGVRKSQTFTPWTNVQTKISETRDFVNGSDQAIYKADILGKRIFEDSDFEAFESLVSPFLGDRSVSKEEMCYRAFMPFTQKYMYISDEAFINLNQDWMLMSQMDVISRPQYKWDVVEVEGVKYLQATQFTRKPVCKVGEAAPRNDFAYDDVTSVLFDQQLNVVNTVKMPGYLYATQQASPAASPKSVMGTDTTFEELNEVGDILDRARYTNVDKLIVILQDGVDVEQRRKIFQQLLMVEPNAYDLKTEAMSSEGRVVDTSDVKRAFTTWIDKVSSMVSASTASDHHQHETSNPMGTAHAQLQQWLRLIHDNKDDVERILASPEKQKIIDNAFAQLQKRQDGSPERRSSVSVPADRSTRRSDSRNKLREVVKMVKAAGILDKAIQSLTGSDKSPDSKPHSQTSSIK